MILPSVRNQDLVYFFRGFRMNTEAFYTLREFFEASYDYNSVRSTPFRSMCPDRLPDGLVIDQQAPRDDVLEISSRWGFSCRFLMHPLSHENSNIERIFRFWKGGGSR